MPRHTHPAVRSKHSRAHIREQRDRQAARRWKQAKDRYGFSWSRHAHPEDQRNGLADPRDIWWPFDLSANQLARNPFSLCSCELCSAPRWHRRAARRRQRPLWAAEIADQLDSARPGEPPMRRHGAFRIPDLTW